MTQADSKKYSAQVQQQTVQMASYPQHFENDTIEIYELWISLWNMKWLVIAVTVVAAIGSIVYALQQQNVYKAEALLLPPKEKDIQSLNLIGIRATVIEETANKIRDALNPEKIFSRFKENLKSPSVLKKFINEYGLMELLAPERTSESRDHDIVSGFRGIINIGFVDQSTLWKLSIDLHDPDIAAQWVNDLIEYVDKETVVSVVDELQNSIANQIRGIEYNISSKRLMAEKRREDQIVRYTEHAKIAKQIGMIGRIDATNIIKNTQVNVDIATTSTPLYYLGFEALMTQIEILRTRESDDPFIKGLRDLQEQLAMLRTIKFDQEKMSSVHVDQAAYKPNNPIKPNRRLIVSIATLFGLFSGIFLAFLIEYVQKERKKRSG